MRPLYKPVRDQVLGSPRFEVETSEGQYTPL